MVTKKKEEIILKNNTVSGLGLKIHTFNTQIQQITRFLLSKVLVFKSMYIGFLIHQQEVLGGISLNIFWPALKEAFESLNCTVSKTVLYESKRLYVTFQRFIKVINNELSIENILISPKLSKKHLLLIDAYCKSEIQQDIFMEKVIRHSLNTTALKSALISGIPSSSGEDDILIVGDLSIKTTYDLSKLSISNDWGEDKIKKHIIKNISIFIDIVLGSKWGFFPKESTHIGGRRKYPDLVFYNKMTNRYCIIDLKCSNLSSEMDRAKSQMAAFLKGYDNGLDLTYQKKSIGIILSKAPIDTSYFNSTVSVENLFYVEFLI